MHSEGAVMACMWAEGSLVQGEKSGGEGVRKREREGKLWKYSVCIFFRLYVDM